MFVSVLCFACTACGGGNSIPEGMSEDDYHVGENLFEVVEDYIDRDKTASEAAEKIDDLSNRFSGVDHNTSMLQITAQSLSRKIVQPNPDLDSIKTERDEIKTYLGK